MKIADFFEEQLKHAVHQIRPDVTLTQTAQLMMELKVGALVVTDQNANLLGIVSERDLLQVVADYRP